MTGQYTCLPCLIDNVCFTLQKASFADVVPIDGCHRCRVQPPVEVPAMTVHGCAPGLEPRFEGWYNMVVHAAEKQSTDSESGEEADISVQDFQQDRTHFVVSTDQVKICSAFHNANRNCRLRKHGPGRPIFVFQCIHFQANLSPRMSPVLPALVGPPPQVSKCASVFCDCF